MINHLWAKSNPYQTLPDHLIQTGMCAVVLLRDGSLQPVLRKLAASFGLPPDKMLPILAYFAAIHDIGKCHPLFQSKTFDAPGLDALQKDGLLYRGMPADQIASFRHEKYAYPVCKRLWEPYADFAPDFWEALERAVSLHHQGKNGDGTRIPSACRPQGWESLQNKLNDLILAYFHPDLGLLKNPAHADASIMQIMGLIILSDWIASGAALDSSGLQQSDLETHVRKSIAERGLLARKASFGADSFTALWPAIPREGLRGVQQACEDLGKSPDAFYLIEAPMGEGKSEAALYLALQQMRRYNADGFYMALPTSASSNQMFSRVNYMLSSQSAGSARLLHATAWMLDESTPEDPAQINNDDAELSIDILRWLSPLRRGLLSQFAVGTVDQAMLAVLMVRYGVLRLLGLSSKVLVLDEVHAYDTYMQTIIERLLSWCRALEIPVILLSATLPQEKKRALLAGYGASMEAPLSSEYPLITSVSAHGGVTQTAIKRVHMKRTYRLFLHPFFGDPEQTAMLAERLAQDGGCICVMMNTVKRAQQVYLALKQRSLDVIYMLFHARFPYEDRQRIERECVSFFGKSTSGRPKKCILVSTQVLEQSIDADFDALITDIAPIDLLLQRMGRVHRFDNMPRPDCLAAPQIHVLNEPSGRYDGQAVYASLLMRRTEALLRERDCIETPEDIRSCVERVYTAETPTDAEEYESWAAQAFSHAFDAATAEGNLLNSPNPQYAFLSQSVPAQWLEDDPLVSRSAHTRLGDGGRTVILLSPDELPTVNSSPNRETAIRLLKRSVSIPAAMLGDPPADAIQGTGFLRGALLLPTQNEKYAWGEYDIWCDSELGVRIEKKDKVR